MIRNSRGFSILETMIAVGLIGIIGLGLTSLLTEMSKQQRASNVKALLGSHKLKIENLIKDQQAWSQTVNTTTVAGANNTELACMRVPISPCTPTTINAIALYESTNTPTVWFNERVATNGFTSQGAPCTTYPSNTCPIRWDFQVINTCQGAAATCVNPTTQVIAVPTMPVAQQEALGLSLNPLNYRVDVTRGAGTRFDPILVLEKINITGPANSASAGAGTCGGGSVFRQFNPANAEVQDPGNNVVVAAMGEIEFQPGSYQCRITAPAFKVDGHSIVLETTTGTRIGEPSAPAVSSVSNPTMSVAILEVAFIVNGPTRYRVRHNCDNTTGMGSAPTTYQMGYGTNYAAPSGTTFASLSCYRNG